MSHMRIIGRVFSERDREIDAETRQRDEYLSPDADDHDFYGDDPEDDIFESFDCAMDRQGYCGKAGSEECDWECPYSRLRGLRDGIR